MPSAGRRSSTNLKDVVADHIRNLIFAGRLRPGQKIDQDEIAEVSGVSKLSVREALILLENEALVRGVPRTRCFRRAIDAGRCLRPLRNLRNGGGHRRPPCRSRISATAELESWPRSHRRCTRTTCRIGRRTQLRVSPGHQRRRRYPQAAHRVALLSRHAGPFYEIAGGWADIAGDQHRQIEAALRVAGRRRRPSRRCASHILSGGEYAVEILRDPGFWDSNAE